ncbi:MAG: hypothetical protein JWM11_7588 [Planctomycetaceae bacterium]|nr:hypothetical protein [Planctomycetaceae bacterium]
MKRIAWTSCVIVLLQALTGCCSCCDMNRSSQCYSNCLPANAGMAASGGCCGNDAEYGLPPSPYANSQVIYSQGGPRIRGQRRGLPPVYSTDPYVDMGTTVGDGSMYENFGGEVITDGAMQQSVPTDSGWQPKPASPMPAPPMPPMSTDSGPSANSVPQPIPAISTSQVPGPPSSNGIPQTSSNFNGPNMGPTPPPIPDPVSQMGYRRPAPIQRAF